MINKLIVPEQVKAGFQKRSDTYEGLLGYVIYQDSKKVWRKADSWQKWCKSDLGVKEFKNVPTEGFVLNKDVGGTRHSYGWNARIEKVRVYDPRGFEFEIDIPNLLFILRECSSFPGKALGGEFVYSWNGPQLVLLPTSCLEYQNSVGFTKLQTKKVSSKELVIGCVYQNKQQENLIYLGRYEYHSTVGGNWKKNISYNSTEERYTPIEKKSDKKYIFWNPIQKKFIPQKSLNFLASRVTETPESNIAFLIDDFFKTKWSSKMKEFKVIPISDFSAEANVDEKSYGHSDWSKEELWIEKSIGVYEGIRILTRFKNNNTNGGTTGRKIENFNLYRSNRVSFIDGVFKYQNTNGVYDMSTSNDFWGTKKERLYTLEELSQIKVVDLEILLENESKVKLNDYIRTY